jgi:hypothetical protein
LVGRIRNAREKGDGSIFIILNYKIHKFKIGGNWGDEIDIFTMSLS